MASQSTLTSGSSTTDATSYSTASVSPTADALVLLSLVTRTNGAGAGEQLPSSVSGAGLTFDLVGVRDFDDADTCLSLWRAMASSPSSGAITMSGFAANQQRALWHVWQVTGLPAGALGSNGINAVVQEAEGTATTGTALTATLAAFASASNWTFIATGTAGSLRTTTAVSPITELTDFNSGELTAALHTGYAAEADTTPELTASGSCAWAVIAIEIKTVAGGGLRVPSVHVRQAVSRAAYR